MYYLIQVMIILPNLYYAIVYGFWYSWLVVGFIIGLITYKAMIDIIDGR